MGQRVQARVTEVLDTFGLIAQAGESLREVVVPRVCTADINASDKADDCTASPYAHEVIKVEKLLYCRCQAGIGCRVASGISGALQETGYIVVKCCS
jgi:hypothetical protein